MNKPELVNIEGGFEARAAEILRNIPGFEVTLLDRGGPHRADAVLRFNGGKQHLLIEFKRRVNAAVAPQLLHYAQTSPSLRLMVVAEEMTIEARRLLEDAGVAVVDAAGYADIKIPGLIFHTEGRTRDTRKTTPQWNIHLSNKAGIAVQALLLNPDRKWQVKDLAQEARVSVGLAHNLLRRLDAEGLTGAEGAGPNKARRVVNAAGLLDVWTEEQKDRAKTARAYLYARNHQDLMQSLSKALEAAGVAHAISGSAAANLMAPFITAVPVVEVWHDFDRTSEEVCQAAKAQLVSEGSNLLLKRAEGNGPLAFRDHLHDVSVANRFRVYLDVKRDPRRGEEQAQHLRTEVIGF